MKLTNCRYCRQMIPAGFSHCSECDGILRSSLPEGGKKAAMERRMQAVQITTAQNEMQYFQAVANREAEMLWFVNCFRVLGAIAAFCIVLYVVSWIGAIYTPQP